MSHRCKYQYDFSEFANDGFISLRDVAKIVGRCDGVDRFEGCCELLEISARDHENIEGFSGATLTLEIDEDDTFLNWLLTGVNERGESVFIKEIYLETDKIPVNANEMFEQLLEELRQDRALIDTVAHALS